MRKRVWVRVPSGVPNPYSPNLFPIGDGFGLLVFFDRYESTYFVNMVNDTMQTARWVYDLPGGFCGFLRPGNHQYRGDRQPGLSQYAPYLRRHAVSGVIPSRDRYRLAPPPQTWDCVIVRTVSVGIPAISLPKISRRFPPVSMAASWDLAAADAASWSAWMCR